MALIGKSEKHERKMGSVTNITSKKRREQGGMNLRNSSLVKKSSQHNSKAFLHRTASPSFETRPSRVGWLPASLLTTRAFKVGKRKRKSEKGRGARAEPDFWLLFIIQDGSLDSKKAAHLYPFRFCVCYPLWVRRD